MSHMCPICVRPLSVVEDVLLEREPSFQCHHCWNVIREAETVKNAPRRGRLSKFYRLKIPAVRKAA